MNPVELFQSYLEQSCTQTGGEKTDQFTGSQERKYTKLS